MPPLPNQAAPGPPLPDQARLPSRGRPARGSQPADSVKRKGKGRPLKLQAAASCSVLPFLHTLELCFTGTSLGCISTLLTLYTAVVSRYCWNPAASPQTEALFHKHTTLPHCSRCILSWFPAIAATLPPLPRLELCFTGKLLCRIPTLLTLYYVVAPRGCWSLGSSPQIVAVLHRLSTVPRT